MNHQSDQVPLGFFRADHRHGQINEQQHSDSTDNEIFHKSFLQFFAESDVQSTDQEKTIINAT